jgi:hypothetical protein
MPSTSTTGKVTDWMTAQQNVTVFTAILVALPLLYAFNSTVSDSSGSFLFLITLAVVVPTAYNELWSRYEQTWKAIGWVVVGCTVAAVEFTGIYLVSIEVGAPSSLIASTAAFLVTALGNIVWLTLRKRR